MMSFFNIYYGIFYELCTFAYFDRLCKLEKRGDENLKKSSPLKLLSQSQPNFAEMILGWSSSKIAFPGTNMVQGRNTLGYLRTRTFYTPERKYAYKYASITKCLTCSP